MLRLCLLLGTRFSASAELILKDFILALRSILLRLEILVTTQPTQPENNDSQVTVVEESSAPNSPSSAGATEIPASIQDNPIPLFTTGEAAPSFTALIEEFRQR